MKNLIKLISLIILLISSACSYRPILGPSQRYNEVGKDGAKADVDQCLDEADVYLKGYKAKRAAKEAVRKGAIGGVIGAASGALRGRNLKSSLVGSAIGVGVGAAIGAALVAGEDKVTPDQIKQRYVTQCLAGRGYNVIGWE